MAIRQVLQVLFYFLVAMAMQARGALMWANQPVGTNIESSNNDYEQRPDNNLRRYFLKGKPSETIEPLPTMDLTETYHPRLTLAPELDLDGYTLKDPNEQWKLIRLGQLLDTLSSTIPTPAPIYRSGRTYPTSRLQVLPDAASDDNLGQSIMQDAVMGGERAARSGINENGAPQYPQQQQATSWVSPEARKLKARKPSTPLKGLVWPRTRASGTTPYSGSRHSQMNATLRAPHHKLGTEEVALHTPIHSRSTTDYEWKRVENSRWNNLRGMWGKRSMDGSTSYGSPSIVRSALFTSLAAPSSGDGDGLADSMAREQDPISSHSQTSADLEQQNNNNNNGQLAEQEQQDTPVRPAPMK